MRILRLILLIAIPITSQISAQDSAQVFVASPADKPASIVAWGDFGTGSTAQKKVAEKMREYHSKTPFSFGITLGNNFYPRGLQTTENPRWKRDFEDLYSPMGIKVYPIFGKYDWEGESRSAEVKYSQLSKTWSMPAEYYTFIAGPAQFFAVNTNDLSGAQLKWLAEALGKSKSQWKIVYGHVPPYAASETSTVDSLVMNVLWPVLKKGNVNAYFAGSHRNMQHLKSSDGIAVFINGGGGQGLFAINPDDPRAIFINEDYGFSVIDVDNESITVRFVNINGYEIYNTRIDKKTASE